MESQTDNPKTDNPPRHYRRPRRSTRGLTTRVAALASAAALALGAGLSLQLARGADPALGPKAQVAKQGGPTRVVKTTLVVRRVQSGSNPPASSSSGSPATSTASAPVSSPGPVSTSTS